MGTNLSYPQKGTMKELVLSPAKMNWELCDGSPMRNARQVMIQTFKNMPVSLTEALIFPGAPWQKMTTTIRRQALAWLKCHDM